MEILVPDPARRERIDGYASRDAFASLLARGSGAARVFLLTFEPGGEIGPHPAGFGQLFWVTRGSGWVAGPDGQRLPVAAGQGAWFPRGETHAKGSETGMTAVMVQVDDLSPAGH